MQAVSARNFLGGLSPDHFDTFRAVMRPIDLADGELLCVEGDLACAAWFVERGALETVRSLPGGGETLVATARSGELVGELGLIVDTRRTASLRAKGVTRVLEVDRSEFSGVVSHFHSASLGIMRRLDELLIDRLQKALRAVYLLDGIEPPVVSEGGETTPGSEGEQRSDFDPKPFLSALPFFEGYGAHDLEEFLEQAEPKWWSLPRGRCVAPRGARVGACFVVVRGAVELCASDGDRARRVGLLGPGASIGIPPLLSGEVPLTVAHVREDALVMEISEANLRKLWNEGHRMAFRFASAVARDMGRQVEHLTRVLARLQPEAAVSGAGRVRKGTSDAERPLSIVAAGRGGRIWLLEGASGFGRDLGEHLGAAGFDLEHVLEHAVLSARVGSEAAETGAGAGLIIADPEQAELILAQMGPELPPVVVISTRHDVDEAVRCVRSGARDYISLGEARERIVARLRLHLQRESFRG